MTATESSLLASLARLHDDAVAAAAGLEAGHLFTSASLMAADSSAAHNPRVLYNNETTEHGDTVPCSGGMFFFLVYGPVYGAVCGFGLIGNSLSFAIMQKYSKDTVATFLLKALAVMDNVFLATAAFVYMYPAMVIHVGQTDQLQPIYTYFQTLAWPLTHMVQMGTVWMMVLVAANRYIAICRPLHAARLCSKRNVKRQIAAMIVCIFLYNTPRFVEYRYIYVNATSPFDADDTKVKEVNIGLASYPLYNYLYENIAYCLFVYLIPLGILIVFNVQLVNELKRAQRSRQRLVGRASAEENNITLVMIIIIVSFIVFETPASINQILYYLIDDYEKLTCSNYMRYSHVSNLMITTNSSLNFAIYCLFRRQFRQELVALLCRRRLGRRTMGIRRTILLRAMHQSSASENATGNSTYYEKHGSHDMRPITINGFSVDAVDH